MKYQKEPAYQFYTDLQKAYSHQPNYTEVYEGYSRLFSLLLFQHTADIEIKFTGNFSRTSYLLRENNATPYETKIVNDARVRLRNIATLSDNDKQQYASIDLKALAILISLVTKTEIPSALQQHFPNEQTDTPTITTPHADVIRMIVDNWDDNEIVGPTDAEGAPEVHVTYTGGPSGNDNTYIKEHLKEGAILNLINPTHKDDTLSPDHIIYEPDMLIDVTSIASCFQDYSVTELTYIINKFSPFEETVPIVLGNLAGQLLDEEINMPIEENTFKRSINEFYIHNPLSLITTDIVNDRKKFLDDAQQQKDNIRHAIRETLPKTVGRFNPKEIILEPSFISEILGIQGRMDFLQLDKKVVIEQKSGKCGFPQPNPDVPVGKLQHYIQVLLYMMVLRYNFSDEYKKNHGTQAFLLYSKYKDSLLALDFAPRLIYSALKIRNQIVAAEYKSAADGYAILDTMQASELLQNEAKAQFFSRFKEGPINDVLHPIQRATPLARAYFHRFVKFTSTEHLLSRIGSGTKANSGFAAAWNDSLDDKLQAGNIYARLTLNSLPIKDGKVEEVILNISHDTDNDMSNFRPGDIAMLYPYHEDEEPDARRAIVFRSTLTEINVDTLTLKLRAPQSDPNVFNYYKHCKWAVEHDFMESSYSSIYRGLHAMLTTKAERRDLILMQRPPQTDTNITLNGDYGRFNELMLSVKQAQDIYLILGPPGSGKTSYGMLNTLKEQLSEPDTSVLLLSYTNRAVDEICSKLIEADIDFIRLGSINACSPEYVPHLISERVRHCPKMSQLEHHLRSARVYVSTVTSLNGNTSLFQLKTFNLAIIDEASQILEPHLMPLLCATNAQGLAIKKFVMIGDHKQLPAVVQQGREESKVTDERLQAIGVTDCRNSLFQRFYEAYGDDPTVTRMLTHQGRMHHDIADFASHHFYEDRLQEVPLPHQQVTLHSTEPIPNALDALVTTCRTAFIAIAAPEEQYSCKVNQNEADAIAALAYHIYMKTGSDFNPDKTVGVIVPYRNQISTIRNTIARNYDAPALKDITIDTVERYQGSQRKYIIYGFTVSRQYQLNFLTSTNFIDKEGNEIDRKLNVAMTRAMEHLYIIGNPQILSLHPIYRSLISYHRHNGSYYDIPLQQFIAGSF